MILEEWVLLKPTASGSAFTSTARLTNPVKITGTITTNYQVDEQITQQQLVQEEEL